MPINILVYIFLMKGGDGVSSFSLFIALMQVLSNIDFGVNAVLLSNKREFTFYRVINYYVLYLKKVTFWKVFLVILSVFIYSYFFNVGNGEILHIVIFSLLCAEVVIFYNLASNASISESNYKLIHLIISITAICEVIVLLFFWGFNNDIHFYNMITTFVLSLFVGCICGLVYILRSEKKVTNGDYSFSFRLQMSQLSSSLILNKDYILLYLFSMNKYAVIFAAIARVMLIPMQVNSVIISKMWVDIANSQAVRKTYLNQQKKLFFISVFLCFLPITFCLYKYGEDTYLISILLFLFVVFNTFSGLSSAYAAVDRDAIPSATWYLIATIFVFLMSVFVYYVNAWEASLLITSAYFYILSRKNIKGVKWS